MRPHYEGLKVRELPSTVPQIPSMAGVASLIAVIYFTLVPLPHNSSV